MEAGRARTGGVVHLVRGGPRAAATHRERDSGGARFLRSFLCIPFDERLAEKAARLARLYRLKIPDAAIAATAADCAMPLVSRDRGFRKVKEVSLVEV